jgi:hypothetical protein
VLHSTLKSFSSSGGGIFLGGWRGQVTGKICKKKKKKKKSQAPEAYAVIVATWEDEIVRMEV